jgi:hypothetical protein
MIERLDVDVSKRQDKELWLRSDVTVLLMLDEMIRRRFRASRYQSADYLTSGCYSPQWHAHGCVNYWSRQGRVYALVELKSRMGYYWSRGCREVDVEV